MNTCSIIISSASPKESIPDPSYLKVHVVNATGYGTGQMNYENWERSLVRQFKQQ
jgi:hypothetical protein